MSNFIDVIQAQKAELFREVYVLHEKRHIERGYAREGVPGKKAREAVEFFDRAFKENGDKA